MKKIVILVMLLFSSMSFAQEIGNYLIQSDVGEYKYRPKRTSEIYGNSGILIPAGHFDLDHNDITYKTRYVHPVTILGVDVQVTKHAGSDSDKWLLHEVERGYRKSREMHSVYISANPLRAISNNKIFYTWGYYTWVSNNVVVSIEFTDYTGTKPEPLEVVQAYLQKFPSTIPITFILDKTHSDQWIKDEIDRRLWLCDKWYMQFQLKKVTQVEMLQELVKSMNVFLDYRDKYYGIKAGDEKNLLANYLLQNNGTAIKAKLDEYKKWWTENKGKAISLP